MCTVTEQDRIWQEGGPSACEEETTSERRAAQAALTEINRANEEAEVRLVCMKPASSKMEAVNMSLKS